MRIIAEQWIEEIWNRGNVSLIDEMHDSSYTHHQFRGEEEDKRDAAYVRKWISRIRRKNPDLLVTAKDFIADEHKIAVRWTAQSTGKNSGRQSNGNKPILHGIAIFGIRSGKITDTWVVVDSPRSLPSGTPA